MKLLVSLFLLGLTACGATATQVPACTPAETAGPFLWVVQGPKAPTYFYGTVHAGGRKLLPQVAFDKLAASPVFAAEIDLTTLDVAKLMSRGKLPDGQTLDALIGQERFDKLAAATGDTMPAFALKMFKPWVAFSVLLLSLTEDREALDLVLSNQAREQGKRLEFFETADQQIDILSAAIGVKDLIDALDKLPEMKRLLTALIDAYAAGDHAGLERVAFDPTYNSPQQMELMLYARNAKWIPLADKLIAGEGAFVAVGVAHLVGPKSVIALLEEQGHRVRRIRADGSLAVSCRTR